ncbi:MAG: (2Fe-2S) ferredoxin domain-containing protein [Planctomycetota bacterium]
MAAFEHHIFVCENRRPAGHPRGCCAAKGSEEVRKLFKQECAKRGLKGIVRANMAGCLDQCELGVTVVIYPDAVWYGHVTPPDVIEIMDRHIGKGEIVERLRIPPERLNQPRAGGD